MVRGGFPNRFQYHSSQCLLWHHWRSATWCPDHVMGPLQLAIFQRSLCGFRILTYKVFLTLQGLNKCFQDFSTQNIICQHTGLSCKTPIIWKHKARWFWLYSEQSCLQYKADERKMRSNNTKNQVQWFLNALTFDFVYTSFCPFILTRPRIIN